MTRRTRPCTDPALAVLTEIHRPETRTQPVGAVGRFLERTLGELGEIAPFSVLDVTDDGDPRIVLYTTTGRTYGVTLPGPSGPFELWTFVEVPTGGFSGRYDDLREREEVLAQALHTTRLAWHVNGGTGWIGQPVAVAADESELDDDLARAAADCLQRLFVTVERVCAVIDERERARAARSVGV